MSAESTREVLKQYFNSGHSDVSMMATDVVFTSMAPGQQYHGPEGILQMLNYFYRIAFDATAELKNLVAYDLEADKEQFSRLNEFIGFKNNGNLASSKRVAEKYLYLINHPEKFHQVILSVADMV